MNIKKRFTIWYVQRGYAFGHTDSVSECPFWVKPLLIFFSPSVYNQIVLGEIIYKNLVEGMISVKMAHYPPANHDDCSEHKNDLRSVK